MSKNKHYTGIDYFRFIAALLVIAIHTSPLASINETGDFILTRIISIVAVPFFFMTSGFFTITRYAFHNEKLRMFVKKTALLYGAAILLYIPVNIYNGYFKVDNLLPNIIKDIVFDGTLYHLWYLPASIIGAITAQYFVKRFGYPKALAAASALYLFGLLGDSYYGITEKISSLNSLYSLIFQVTDHTRNGFFFAPVFFILGGLMADGHGKLPFRKCSLGFGLSFGLLFGEAMLLRYFNLPRHDSMYLFLLPCMYFLFNALLHLKGKSLVWLRTSSLIIYMIHPMMIVVIRLFAKLLHLESLLVQNTMVHYSIVSITSVMFAMSITILWNKYNRKIPKYNTSTDRSYVEIDLYNLEHNVKILKKELPPTCKLMAVVKADAYGHGTHEIAIHLNRIGVKAFAAATIDEGIQLRQNGICGEILILGYTAPTRAKELRKYDLTQTLIDYDYALSLNGQGCPVKTHIKIDTGMHRLGFDKDEIEKICSVFTMKQLKIQGIYTHLCASDSLDKNDLCFTNLQIESFYQLLKLLKKKGIHLPKVHIQSSYGLLNYPELTCDYMRAGICLYGVLSSSNDKTKLQLDLKPVLSLKSKVVLLRTIAKGDSVGYSRAFVAKRNSIIAVLPIGYADGYPRNLSCQKSYVLINGYEAPVVGKVCMDQLEVDVTDIPHVRVGMTATLIGKDGDEEITAPIVAENSESITNELLSRMGRRLKVVVIGGK